MAEQPLLPTYQSEPNLQFQDQEEENHDLGSEISFMFPQSTRNQVILEKIEDPFLDFLSKSPHKTNHGVGGGPSNGGVGGGGGRRRKYGLHRSKTAPAIAIMRDLKQNNQPQMEKPKLESSSIIRQAFLLLMFYLSLGVLIYSFNRDNFSGVETHPVVDALYFCIVTMCTIGYGDIAPLTPATKVFACVFVLVGFGFIDILLSGVVNYVLDLQENMILTGIRVGGGRGGRDGGFSAKNYIFDSEKGRMRIRLKVGLALGVVVSCIGTGAMVLYFVEKLEWIDSVYLSVMSVTTVGYGDRAFKTLQGRLFASLWLLLSTLAVARAFLYLAEARIDKRHRRIAKWVLHRDITVEDLLAADINNNGFMSKSEYVIYKLKEMGKICDKDVLQICNQFNKLDPSNSGMTSKLQWSGSMDLVLIRTLVDESNTGGKKTDNGWKSSALECVVEEIKKSHNMVINHDHVRSRLKTFKKQYLAVQEIHKQSGFGFDYSSGLITADIEVWEDYVAAHKEAKKVRGKIFPYYGDLAIIIGNDQATGDRCIASRDDDIEPMAEASESVHTDTVDREDVASGSTTSSRKRKRTRDNDDPEFAKAISSICKAFEQASAMPIRLETFP